MSDHNSQAEELQLLFCDDVSNFTSCKNTKEVEIGKKYG